MKIEVFGPGCAKCARSVEVARAFLHQRGLVGDVVKQDQLDVIIEQGVLRTPTIRIDGKTVVEGRILRETDLEAWLAGQPEPGPG